MEERARELDDENKTKRKNHKQWQTTWKRKGCGVRKIRWVPRVLVDTRSCGCVSPHSFGSQSWECKMRNHAVSSCIMFFGHDTPPHANRPMHAVLSSFAPRGSATTTGCSHHGSTDVNASLLRPHMARGSTPWHAHLPPRTMAPGARGVVVGAQKLTTTKSS